MNSCLSLLESQTVGPALMVPVRMMGHLTVKLVRVPIPQNSPKFATSHFFWELWGPGFGDSAVWVAERTAAELTPFPCWILQAFLSSMLLWPLNISWASGSLHTWQGPRDWSFCSITWHRAVSHCAGKHCTVRVCDFDDYALLLSTGFASLLDKYLARQGIFSLPCKDLVQPPFCDWLLVYYCNNQWPSRHRGSPFFPTLNLFKLPAFSLL